VSVVRRLGLCALGWSLACSGAIPSTAGPSAAPAAKDTRALLAFRMAGAQAVQPGCEWIRWSEATGPETVGKSPDCPLGVVFKPDNSKVIYTTVKQAHVALWPGVRSPVELWYPAHDEAYWDPLWVAQDGVLRLDAMLFPKKTETDDALVLTSGDATVTVKKTPTGGLENLPPYGEPVIRASYEANRKGAGWTLLEATAWKYDSTDPYSPADHPPGWPSLSAEKCNDGQECEKEAWKERQDLLAKLGPDAAPGYLAPGWLFGVRWGDSPHARGPVFWCADPECKETLALKDLPNSSSLSLQPRGELLLVGEESGMKNARVYRRGQAEPIYVVKDGAGAGWLPDGVR
jgi:hypothetical protein